MSENKINWHTENSKSGVWFTEFQTAGEKVLE